MNRRYELTNEQWDRLRALLPPERHGRGRPALDHRTVGILWALCSGSPWRDLPERYGKWTSVYSRFQRWRQSGLWQQVLDNVLQAADEAGKVNWHAHYLDATIVKAHQHAAGQKSRADREALGRSRGGWTTKIHLRADGNGKPLCFILTPGQQHEATVAVQLLNQGGIKRTGRGQPKRRPQRIVADKGYSSRKLRQTLKRRGIRITIPHKANEEQRGRPLDPIHYRQRSRIERCFNRLKQFRRLATRYEKPAATYAAMLTIACVLLWL